MQGLWSILSRPSDARHRKGLIEVPFHLPSFTEYERDSLMYQSKTAQGAESDAVNYFDDGELAANK